MPVYKIKTYQAPHHSCTIFKDSKIVKTIYVKDLSHSQLLHFATMGLAIAARTAANATGIPRDEAIHLLLESLAHNAKES